jgi:hypothetical protein
MSSVDAALAEHFGESGASSEKVEDEYVRLDLRFDPSQCVNCVLENGDTLAKGSGTGYALAREPVTRGKAMWEFIPVQDNPNDETRCAHPLFPFSAQCL